MSNLTSTKEKRENKKQNRNIEILKTETVFGLLKKIEVLYVIIKL
jgi:hypothetical protein